MLLPGESLRSRAGDLVLSRGDLDFFRSSLLRVKSLESLLFFLSILWRVSSVLPRVVLLFAAESRLTLPRCAVAETVMGKPQIESQ